MHVLNRKFCHCRSGIFSSSLLCSSLGENPVHIRSANDQQFCTVQSNTQRPIQTFIKFNSIWPLTVIIVRALLFFCPHVWHTAVFLNNHIPHPHWVGLLRQKTERTNERTVVCAHDFETSPPKKRRTCISAHGKFSTLWHGTRTYTHLALAKRHATGTHPAPRKDGFASFNCNIGGRGWNFRGKMVNFVPAYPVRGVLFSDHLSLLAHS